MGSIMKEAFYIKLCYYDRNFLLIKLMHVLGN